MLTPDPGRVTLHLPEPPSLNMMLDMAKERTRRTKGGGWRKLALPTVYDQTKDRYQVECMLATRKVGVFPPRTPWSRWRLESAAFRLHNLRDTIELLAGLKWPIDFLVSSGFVTNDSPRELRGLPDPEQVISRQNRGISITIARLDPQGADHVL
jgi:hypothetical protein